MSIDLIKENGFRLKMARNKRYPTETITDTDYADDIALLANISNQAESLLNCQELAAGSIGLYVNANKTKFMCFNGEGAISTQNAVF